MISSFPRYEKDDVLAIYSGELWDLPSEMIWADATIIQNLPFQSNNLTGDRVLFPGATTLIHTEPLIVGSGLLVDVGANPNTILWLDGPVNKTFSDLLIIGVS